MLWYFSKIVKTCSCKWMPKTCKTHVGLSRVQYAGMVPAVCSVSGGERSEIYHTPGTVSWFSMHFLSDTLCWCATQMPPRPIWVLSELMSVESLYVVVILSEIFQNFRRQQEVVEHPKKRLGVDVKRCWLLPLSFLESVRRSCTLGWFVERVLLKVRKGTGYVALSDLPDDEEENANSGTVCGSISNDLTTWIMLTVYMYIVTQVSPILIDLVQVCANEEGQLNVPLWKLVIASGNLENGVCKSTLCSP